MKISYNWLKWYTPDAPTPEKLADIFTYHLTEVESVTPSPLQGEAVDRSLSISDRRAGGEVIFDLNILPNRAHDLLSHQGIARELAGQLEIPFNDPTSKYKIPAVAKALVGKQELNINIQTPNCRRYMGRIVRGIKVGPSPDWVVKHLESIGQRSINNIVDATNIVMFDCGQPCHAFDLRKIKDSKIEVGPAQDGKELELLGSEKIVAKLKNTDTVIATPSPLQGEGRGEVLALAGVKGGTNSGIALDTTEIVLEVANFDSTAVRKTARRLGILSDAAKRFENDLSPELCDFAMLELSALIAEVACPERPEGVEWEEIIDEYPVKQTERKIEISTELINKKLGTDFSIDEIENVWKRYNFKYEKNESSFTITPSALRLDLVIPEDLVEEVGRILGYDKVVPVLPKINFTPKINETWTKIASARNKLIADGYREVMTYAFTDKGDVQVLASASDKKYLRTNISEGLKKSIALNQINAPLLGIDKVKVFEIGTVFSKGKEIVNLAYGDKKNVTEVTLDEYINTTPPNLPLSGKETAVHSIPPDKRDKGGFFKMWSAFPFISRDIALWVPADTSAESVAEVINKDIGDLLVKGPDMFDQFKKEDKQSYAFRLVFQSFDRTLTDEEINPIMESITKRIGENGWMVR